MQESNTLRVCRNQTHCEYAGIELTASRQELNSLRVLQEPTSLRVGRNQAHCEYAGIERTANVQEFIFYVFAFIIIQTHCEYAGMVNKGSPRGEDQEADNLYIGYLEESRYGHLCT